MKFQIKILMFFQLHKNKNWLNVSYEIPVTLTHANYFRALIGKSVSLGS